MKPVTVRERKNVWQQMDALNVEQGYVYSDEGFTAAEYAERYRLTITGAKGRLLKLTRAGKLTSNWTLRNHVRTKLYTFPTDPRHDNLR